MQKDIQIYQTLGKFIQRSVPLMYLCISCNYKLSIKNSFLDSEYIALLDKGKKEWITVEDDDFFDLLIELRDFMVSQGQPPWTGMIFTLHADGRFSTEFSYEPLESDEED